MPSTQLQPLRGLCLSVSFPEYLSASGLDRRQGKLWIKIRIRAQLHTEARAEVYKWLEAIQEGLWYGRDWSLAGLSQYPVHPPLTAVNRICYPPTTIAQRDFFITLALILHFKSSQNNSPEDLTSTFLDTES